MKIVKAAWEYKRAVRKPFKGALRQILWEGLDVETKSMIMQKGFMNFDYTSLCAEILARADLLALRDVALSRSNDVIMGTSSLEPTLSLAPDNEQ